jgi:hypothetical protein
MRVYLYEQLWVNFCGYVCRAYNGYVRAQCFSIDFHDNFGAGRKRLVFSHEFLWVFKDASKNKFYPGAVMAWGARILSPFFISNAKFFGFGWVSWVEPLRKNTHKHRHR